MAAALLGAGACDPGEGITSIEIPTEAVEVFSDVRPSYAQAEDRVLVTVDFIPTHGNAAQHRVHVTWDPSRFEYVQAMPPGSAAYLSQEVGPGHLTVDADLTVQQPKTRILLAFRALAHTSTSGIIVSGDAMPSLP